MTDRCHIKACEHRTNAACALCDAHVAIDRVELWDAINEYVVACGGDPSSRRAYGNTPRMKAVVRVENAVRSRREVTKELGRWVR